MKRRTLIVDHPDGNRRVSLVVSVLGFLFAIAAFGQPIKPETPVRPVIAVMSGNVVIYEQPDFGGRSEGLASGDHLLTDWKASSIKIPQGFAAILFESANARGGYGVSVDLLEDNPDLSAFGLNGKVSFVSIFPSTRQGYFWARNSMRAGDFVSGHWERNRAGGNPVNTVAVASPALPGHTPAEPTAIAQQGTTWTITTLGPQSPGDAAQWKSAESLMGVIGNDFRGPQEIGSAAFERASHNDAIPDWINFWYPLKQPHDHRSIVYFKRTLTGIIADTITRNWTKKIPNGFGEFNTSSGRYSLSDAPHIANINGTYEDHDLNIDVIPFVNYMYLIKDAHKPERSTEASLKDLVDSEDDPCTDPFIKVESEVDAGELAKKSIATSLQQRLGKQVAVYGPWIYDKGHCHHPEIHPAEEIWWAENVGSNGRKYHLNVFCDSSERFWWRSQMDDGTKLKPWGAPPITGLFAIAFEVPISSINVLASTGKRFDVANVDFQNVATIPNSDKVYSLVYQNTTLVSFAPHNDAFRVSFEGVGLNPGTRNTVRGFLVIETTVGSVRQIATRVQRVVLGNPPHTLWVDVPAGSDPDKIDQSLERAAFEKRAGHYVFTITQTDIGGREKLKERALN